jgi:hypothetical protein
MLYKSAFERQVMFLRDDLAFKAGLTDPEGKDGPLVIATHRSKSITLPVVEFTLGKSDAILTLRNNFYDWKLSVKSERVINANFGSLFHTTPPTDPGYTGNELSPVYFEGFPEDRIYGYYCQDRREWSACIHDNYDLCTTLFLIMEQLGLTKQRVWSTR